VLLLAPVMLVVAWLLAAFAIGAPAHAEVIVPIVTPPPADAYQDIGIVALSSLSEASVWVARGLFAVARTIAFATIAALVVARAHGEVVTLAAARRALRARAATFAALGGLSFGYGLLVSQQASLDPARDATVAASALAAGMLVLPSAFIAAAGGRRLGRAIGRGIATRRPLGHVILVAGYGAGVNGLYRLASFGEPGRPGALPMTLYAVAAAWLAVLFALTLARRAVLLEPGEPPLGPPATGRRKGRKRT